MFREQSFRVRTDYLAGAPYAVLLPICNFIDDIVFNIAIMRPFRPFVLVGGEHLR